MKVALLHSAFIESGGAERVIFNQARYLRSYGHQIDCFGSIIDYKKCYPNNFDDIVLRPYIINMPLPKLRYSLTLSASLLFSPYIDRKIRDYDITLCHHHPGPWIGYRAHKKYGKPFICYVHHPPLFLYPEYIPKDVEWGAEFDRKAIFYISNLHIPHSLLLTMDSISISEADAVVANSKKVAKQIKRIYGRNATVCYPSVDINCFKPLPTTSTDYIHSKFNLNHPFTLSVGRHVPIKRLDWLLQIASMVRKEVSATFVIAGPINTYTFTLMKLAKKLGIERDVKFIGEICDNDLLALYNESDALVFTSSHEPFGMVPLEAMACGTPVVAWNSGGPSETVIDGITGYKVKPYNLNDLTQKTINLLSNEELKRKMSQNAVSHVQQHFTWEKHTEILERVLRMAG